MRKKALRPRAPADPLEHDPELADHLALEDVAEHVLLDVLVREVDDLDRGRQLVAQPLERRTRR